MHNAFKRKEIDFPTNRKFCIKDMLHKYTCKREKTERDKQLFSSAWWISSQISAARNTFDHFFDFLDKNSAIQLGVAQTNFEYINFSRKVQTIQEKERTLYLGYENRKRVYSPTTETELGIESINTTLAEIIPHIIHSTENNSLEDNIDFPYTEEFLRYFGASCSITSTISYLWQKIFWNNWYITNKNNNIYLKPNNLSMEILWRAWHWRHEALITEKFNKSAINISKSNYRERYGKYRTVTKIRWKKQHWELTLATVSHIESVITKSSTIEMCNSSYVKIFLHEELPEIHMSISKLNECWQVITDISILIAKDLNNFRITNRNDKKYSATIKRRSLVYAIEKCCLLSKDKAETVVDFFTFDLKKNNAFKLGVWSMPLVPIEQNEKLTISLSSVLTGVPHRRAEQWMHRTGFDKGKTNSRMGIIFEKHVRKTINKIVDNNFMFKDFKTIDAAYHPSIKEIGDIDMLLRIGNLIIIGEIKCFFSPCDPQERHNHLRKIEDASKQLSKKVTWAQNNTSALKTALGGSGKYNILPIIILNTPFGSSLNYDGNIVTDIDFLELILGSNVIYLNAAIIKGTGVINGKGEILYKSQKDLEDKIHAILNSPLPLERYKKRATLTSYSIPKSTGGYLYVDEITSRKEAFITEYNELTAIIDDLF